MTARQRETAWWLWLIGCGAMLLFKIFQVYVLPGLTAWAAATGGV